MTHLFQENYFKKHWKLRKKIDVCGNILKVLVSLFQTIVKKKCNEIDLIKIITLVNKFLIGQG